MVMQLNINVRNKGLSGRFSHHNANFVGDQLVFDSEDSYTLAFTVTKALNVCSYKKPMKELSAGGVAAKYSLIQNNIPTKTR